MKKGLLTVCLVVSMLAVQGCGGAPASTANPGKDTSSTASSTASESEKTAPAEEKYADIIEALDNENYDEAIALIEAMKPQPKEEVIEITLDNWSKYFEIVRVNEIDEKNADGSVKSIHAYDYFRIKDEYKDKLISCDLGIGYTWKYESKQVTSVNKDDLTFELVTADSIPDILNQRYVEAYHIDEEQSGWRDLNGDSFSLCTPEIYYELDDIGCSTNRIPVSDFERCEYVYVLDPVNYQIITTEGTITLSE